MLTPARFFFDVNDEFLIMNFFFKSIFLWTVERVKVKKRVFYVLNMQIATDDIYKFDLSRIGTNILNPLWISNLLRNLSQITYKRSDTTSCCQTYIFLHSPPLNNNNLHQPSLLNPLVISPSSFSILFSSFGTTLN